MEKTKFSHPPYTTSAQILWDSSPVPPLLGSVIYLLDFVPGVVPKRL